MPSQQPIDFSDPGQLTAHVIERMQTGVIVVDKTLSIRLINESACRMVGIASAQHARALPDLSQALTEQLQAWRLDSAVTPQNIRPAATHIEIQPRFARLGAEGQHQGDLIFLQDTSATAQHAQQLQLASLGQLSAGIAHEIRNPLSAISHAGQLLAESDKLDEYDQRLTRIIADNSRRLNAIVENVMLLSRREARHSEVFPLEVFVTQFMADYPLCQDLDPGALHAEIQPGDVQVRFDPGQLRQILVNLCDNALRHSRDYPRLPKVVLSGGICDDSQRPFLEVLDHGPGVPTEHIPRLFEPFFTAAENGTGLGLYISRQLAESNQARLNYIQSPTGGACFRINFQDPRRNIN